MVVIFVNDLAAIDHLNLNNLETGPFQKIIFIAKKESLLHGSAEHKNQATVFATSNFEQAISQLVKIASDYDDFDFYIAINSENAEQTTSLLEKLVSDIVQNRNRYHVFCIAEDLPDSSLTSNSEIKIYSNQKSELVFATRRTQNTECTEPNPFKRLLPAIGISQKALNQFAVSQASIMEKFEKLELLRFVDMSISIKLIET